MTGELFAGTSGFAYPQWKPAFYPPKLPAKQFLQHYAGRLNSVEINYTFRRTPSPTTVENWVHATPEGFRFSLKAPMRVTHIHRLRNAKEPTDFFLRAIDPLRVNGRLGVVLFQLPPQFRCDLDVLGNFLAELPHDLRYAFEFRHASWHDEAVYELLRDHNECLCLAESEKLEAPEVVTADFVYFRLRKQNYTAEDRAVVSDKARRLLSEGKTRLSVFQARRNPRGRRLRRGNAPESARLGEVRERPVRRRRAPRSRYGASADDRPQLYL